MHDATLERHARWGSARATEMPRHVDPDDNSFRRSLIKAALGGLAALVVTFGITGVLTQLGRDRGEDGPAITFTGAPSAPAAVTQAPPTSEASAAPPSDVSVDPTPQPTSEPAPEQTDGSVVDVTVQVLDAVGSGTFAEDAAAALRELGYEVVVINTTPRRVEQTTVLYTDGHREDAEQLRNTDERFGEVRANADFSPSVDLHVLVGPDFTS